MFLFLALYCYTTDMSEQENKQESKTAKPHVLILGAGFGGVYVTKRLLKKVQDGRIDVTIVNRTNYFLFTPLLHEVATGALTPGSVAEPLREVFRKTNVRIIQGNIDSINAANKTATISGTPISYDYLVVATGAETNYYGIAGAEQFSYSLKNLADAARIRSRVIDSFEKASLSQDPAERARLLSFAVVGGGATGVEMAAELAEFADAIAHRYYSHMNWAPHDVQISIVDVGPELLQMFAPKLRKAAQKRLQKEGVALHLNSAVTSVTAEGLTLSTNTTVPAATVIWSAGVKAIIPKFDGVQPVVTKGRMTVDSHFILTTAPATPAVPNPFANVFVLGDAAGYPKPVPMLAQAAEVQAKVVADNLIAAIAGKPLGDFTFNSKGSMVSVGQWFAIGEIFSLKISGRLTWWLWRTVYLFKFASFKKRIRIMFEWSLELFFPRDITKIVG
jgi:NADH dehydrogenase